MSGDRRPYLRSGPHRRAVAAQLRQEYEDGAAVAELVEQHGISRSTVQRLLWEAGTAMRPPQPYRPPLRPATAEDLDPLVDSWLQERP